MRCSLCVVLGAIAFLACGTNPETLEDAGIPPVDSGVPTEDAGTDAGSDFTSCLGACGGVDAGVAFGAVNRSFTRAFFGLSSPAKTDGGWEVYLEASAGGDDGCPSPTSATPDYLLIVSGLPAPTGPVSATPKQTTLVDFEGALLPSAAFSHATQSTVTWSAADICIACSQGTQPDRAGRFVALDYSASFDAGTSQGHLYATHCESLDDL